MKRPFACQTLLLALLWFGGVASRAVDVEHHVVLSGTNYWGLIGQEAIVTFGQPGIDTTNRLVEVVVIHSHVESGTTQPLARIDFELSDVFGSRILTFGITAGEPSQLSNLSFLLKHGGNLGALEVKAMGGNGGIYVLLRVTPVAAQQSSALLPQNSIVIPSDTTGPVQVYLESSTNLADWVATQPGTYGSTSYERFFRVRATLD